MVRWEQLPGSFGIRLLDLEIGAQGAASLREVAALFYKHRFVVVPRQQLSLQQFDQFSRCFGIPRPHFLDHLRMEGHPSILMLSNIYENGRQLGIYEGACFWHTDVAYEKPPNSATVVYSIKTPRNGGAATQIADMVAAYDALPARVKAQIENLTVVHHYGNRDDTREGSPTAAERLTPRQRKRVRNVYHPLVLRHPVTGQRALYGVAGSSFGILGMDGKDALKLLRELADHATQSQFTISYDYCPGDVACWDTLATLHKAPAQKPAAPNDDHARLLWRVSLTGISPFI